MKCLLVIALYLLGTSAAAQSLTIRFFDVGQGDAVLISEGGKHVLVDAGTGPDIVEHLRSAKVDTIELLIASHNHDDHIGAMSYVFGAVKVRNYMQNGVRNRTSAYRRTMQSFQVSGAQYITATPRTITIGNAQLRILTRPATLTDQNNSSIGVLLSYGTFKALLTGDSETLELGHWLSYDSIPRVQVVKVAHHGSLNGTTLPWVEATRPIAAVISVGRRNSYGHPAFAVIAMWEAAGARVYRTDYDGTVTVYATPDGSFSINSTVFAGTSSVPIVDSLRPKAVPVNAKP